MPRRTRPAADAPAPPPSQLLTAVGRVVDPDDRTALVLGIWGYAAAKVWNACLHDRETVRDATARAPSCGAQQTTLKDHPWARRLPAQSVQEVVAEQHDAFSSCFALRAKGHADAASPASANARACARSPSSRRPSASSSTPRPIRTPP